MSLRRAILLVGLQSILLFPIGFGIIFPRVVGPDEFLHPTARAFLFAIGLNAAIFVAVTWAGLIRGGRMSFAKLGWRFDHVGRDSLMGVAGAAACVVGLMTLTAAIGESPGEMIKAALSVGPSARALFLVIGLGAAVAEESLFRGYLQPQLISRLGLMFGVLVQATTFSLYHWPRGPLPFAGRFIIGVVLGSLRGRDRSLLSPAVAHVGVWVLLGPS